MRRRYIVGYDIADPSRLRIVHKIALSFGQSLQYSLFVCDLSDPEKYTMLEQFGEAIRHNEDRICLIDLGDPLGRGVECFEFLGQPPNLPEPGRPSVF